MKKTYLFLLGVLGLMASSCEETIEPAAPQQNPQGPVLNIEDITSAKTGVLSSDAVINLENYNSDGTMIPVMKLEKADSLPAGAAVSYKLELSSTDDFSRSVILDTQDGEGDNAGIYSVSASAWNEAHVKLFGKSPKEKTAYYRVPVYVDLDGSDYRLNGTDYYAVSGTLTETCFDQGFVIEDHYYFMSNSTTWDFAEAKNYPFEHAADVSVYDDPVFTIKIEVTQEQIDANGGGSWWKIAPESTVDAQNWNAMVGTEENGDDSLSGLLVGPGEVQSGKITAPGKYVLTINMEAMTYEFELKLQPDVLYTPGDANGWNQLASSWMQLRESDNDSYYYGVFPIGAGGFKICAENNWDNSTTYGAKEAGATVEGDLALGDGGHNIEVKTPGLYWVRVDFDPASYQLTKYTLVPLTRVGLIGSFNGWATPDVEMTTADEGKTWTADVKFDAGAEVKVRFNDGWGYNLGGEFKHLVFDAGNMKVEEAGDYTVTLDLLGGYPKLTLTKK